jgi:hypothetical protein
MKRLQTEAATQALIQDPESHIPQLIVKHNQPSISLAIIRNAEIFVDLI